MPLRGSCLTDQAGDEVTGQSDEEGIGVDGNHGDGAKDGGPPPNVPHVSGHWPSKVHQQLLGIRPTHQILGMWSTVIYMQYRGMKTFGILTWT